MLQEEQEKLLVKLLHDREEDPMIRRWAYGTLEHVWEVHRRYLSLLKYSIVDDGIVFKVKILPSIVEAINFARENNYNLDEFSYAVSDLIADLHNNGKTACAAMVREAWTK